MKKLVLAVAVVVLSSTAFAETKVVSLSEVVTNVNKKNLKIKANALKIYQAKMNIEAARAAMLPRLTIWELAGAIFDPLSLIEKIPDIAPFLVPANWFRLEQTKILFLAEKEGFRALWANQLHSTKALYMKILFDHRLLRHVETSTIELERVHRIVKTHETFGAVKPGTAREMEIRILGLKQDQETLNLLVQTELSELASLLGMKVDVLLELEAITDPDVSNLSHLDHKEFEFRAVSYSPERREYDHLLSALYQVKQEIEYSFWGVSSISRGVAGGIFDAIPISGGIFADDGPSMKIALAQEGILKLQKMGIEETIRRQLRLLTVDYNSAIDNYGIYARRSTLSRESNESLLKRVQLGEAIDAMEFSENARTRISAETARFAVLSRVLVNRDRLDRMLFTGDYAKNPPAIGTIKGAGR